MSRPKFLFSTFLMLVMAIGFVNCNTPETYFEGEIHYTLSYKGPDGSDADVLKVTNGSRMEMLFKNGEWVKRYYNDNNFMVAEKQLDLKNKAIYRWSYLRDKIDTLDITQNKFPTKFTVHGQENIINQPCTKVETIATIEHKGKTIELDAEYLYANNLKTNANWYTDYKRRNYNEIVMQIKNGIFLKHRYNAKSYMAIYNATDIIDKTIDPSLLKMSHK